MIEFKKGSIVPRWTGLAVATNKKAQHWLVFGMDVIFDGKSLKPAREMTDRDYLISIKYGMSAPRKNGTRQQSGFYMGSNWTMHCSSNSFTGEFSAEFVRQSKCQADTDSAN